MGGKTWQHQTLFEVKVKFYIIEIQLHSMICASKSFLKEEAREHFIFNPSTSKHFSHHLAINRMGFITTLSKNNPLFVCVCASLFAMLWKKLHFYWSQGLHHQLLDPIVQQAAPGMLEKDLLSGMNSKLGASSKLGVIVTRKIVANIQLKQSWTLEQHSFFLSQSDWQTANGIPSLHTLNPFDFFSQRCAKQGPFHHTLTHLGNSWLFSIASKTTSKPDLEMQTNRKPGTL